MNISKKLGFLGVVLAAMLLASCAGTESTDDQSGAVADGNQGTTGAEVSPMGGEGVSGSAGDSVSIDNMPVVFYFDFDQATLKADVREGLDIVATVLKASGASVRLEGHADERGTREYNLALGERRAQAVKKYLGAQGVDTSKLEVISYGEEKPVDAASNESAWSKNRRVELVR